MQQIIKKSLNVSSLATLLLMLAVGGVKNDARLIYLSSLCMVWKGSRSATEYMRATSQERAINLAVKPLQVEILQLKVANGNAREEIDAINRSYRLAAERIDEAEKMAVIFQSDVTELKSQLWNEKQRVLALVDELEAKQITINEWQVWSNEIEAENRGRDTVERERLQLKDNEIKRLESALAKTKSDCVEKLDQATADYDAAREELMMAQARILVLEAEIERIHKAKKLEEGLDLNNFANMIVDWFGMVKPAIVIDALTASVQNSDWVLGFEMRNLKDSSRIRELMQALKSDFSLAHLPSLKFTGERFKITIHRAEQVNEAKYLRVDPNWLIDALVFEKGQGTVTHHARFSGSTETGKSTLVCNALGVIIQRVPLVEIELADPLVAGMSNWTTLKPKYKGEDACVEGLLRFYEEFKQLDNGSIKSDRTKIFVLDEFDRMMQNHPQLMPIVLDLWKSGRHQKRYLWVLGQSCLVGKFNLNVEDVQNVIGFYLGNTVERGLVDANDNPEYNSALKQEWHLAKARELRYVCLVRPMTVTGRPFLAVMPKPDTFALGSADVGLKLLDVSNEESTLDARIEEFRLDDARANLEKLLKEVPKELEAIAGLTNAELGKIRKLLGEGMTVSAIVKEVWGLNPSRSDTYKNRKSQVEAVKKLDN